MNKTNLIRKLTSRKFIIAVITTIVGIITMFIGDSEAVNVIAGALMTIIPTIVYCVVEGTIDAKSIETITDATADAAEKLGASESVVGTIEQIGNMGEILVDSENIE
jgi:hypothetical protein